MSSLRTWETVKGRVHDVSGIDNPENWLYESRGGIYYPVEDLGDDIIDSEEIKQLSDYERLVENHDPDMTTEELKNLGIEVVWEKVYGSEEVKDYREGCGHTNYKN